MNMKLIKEMELQDQRKFLSKMQIILANKIMMMELVALGCRINEKKEDREIYVRDISPQQNNDRNNNGKYAAQEQPINSNEWVTGNARTEENHATLWSQTFNIKNFWKLCLCRWGKKYETQKDCKIPKNLFIMVEMIANELDHKHAAESLGRYVKNKILLINFT
uniref:Uncharacterized protein n=1 Tax=Rhizophagus irregularis (strain DAOM 181602 / DAOM 197198 / MUCL 43194) TaxID=747089 RepID=U9SLM9_RHIID